MGQSYSTLDELDFNIIQRYNSKNYRVNPIILKSIGSGTNPCKKNDSLCAFRRYNIEISTNFNSNGIRQIPAMYCKKHHQLWILQETKQPPHLFGIIISKLKELL